MEEKARLDYIDALKEYVKQIAKIRNETRERPVWDDYFITMATIAATRATCLRRGFGAVIVDPPSHLMISTGYCGNAPGTPNCFGDLEVCFREKAKIPSGILYNLCKSVHAEENAVMSAGKEKCKGKTIYVSGIDWTTGELFTGKPCFGCETKLITAGIEEAVYLDNNYNIVRSSMKEAIEKRCKAPFSEQERELESLNKKGFKLE